MRYLMLEESSLKKTFFVSGGFFVSNGTWAHPKRSIEDYELILVLEGCFGMSIAGIKYELIPGDVFLILPGEVHYGLEEKRDVSFYWLHFQLDESRKIIENARLLAPYLTNMEQMDSNPLILAETSRPKEPAQLVVLCNQLLYYQAMGTRYRYSCNLMMELILHGISEHVIKESQKKLMQKKQDFVLERVCDYIRANYYKNLQVAEIAEKFGYNAQYFIRMFHKEMGMTPKQYIVHVQIQKAKQLFGSTNLKICQVAEQVGIADPKVFCKTFKKEEHISPSEYKKTFQKTHYNSR